MRGERGVGLIELLVVMSLLTLALTLFGMAFSAMLTTSKTSREVGAATDQARLALNVLDRQIRFGYWVKGASISCEINGVASTCPAIKVLTTNSSGARECWVWAIDEDPGRLMTFRYSPSNRPIPSLPGDSTSTRNFNGWHIAAGPEGAAAGDVQIAPAPAPMAGDPAGLGPVLSSEVKPLDLSTFQRQSYYLSAYASLAVSVPDSPDRAPINISVTMSVRNQWIGAQYADACG